MLLKNFIALLTLAVSVQSACAAPGKSRSKTCKKPLVRKPWHTMKNNEKRKYIDAELCLKSKPSRLNLPGTVSLFDDLVKSHQLSSLTVHLTGHFLPYHRLFLHAHEQLLRTECNYKGAQPYWAQTLDAGNFPASSLLDPVTGFGGDGVGPEGCVVDGPFANTILTIGPYNNNIPHCLSRRINPIPSNFSAQAAVDDCLAKANFDEFWRCLEGSQPRSFYDGPPPPGPPVGSVPGPHTGGHGGIGGTMSDPVTSPGDPLFFLHHGFVDYIWWKWQGRNETRINSISGKTHMDPDANGGFTDATLADVISVHGLVPDATIAQLADSLLGSPLCVEYEEYF